MTAQLVDDVDEFLGIGDFDVARSWQVDLALGDDPPGPGAHAEDPVGKEHRFAQIMSDENHG